MRSGVEHRTAQTLDPERPASPALTCRRQQAPCHCICAAHLGVEPSLKGMITTVISYRGPDLVLRARGRAAAMQL